MGAPIKASNVERFIGQIADLSSTLYGPILAHNSHVIVNSEDYPRPWLVLIITFTGLASWTLALEQRVTFKSPVYFYPDDPDIPEALKMWNTLPVLCTSRTFLLRYKWRLCSPFPCFSFIIIIFKPQIWDYFTWISSLILTLTTFYCS